MSIDSLKRKEKDYFLRMDKISQEEAKKLLQELGKECKHIEYEEDYAWLNETIITWESYLKSKYGEVYLAPIVPPERTLKRLLPDTDAFSWPLRRPLTELLAYFFLTEPSSGRVAVVFANLVLHLLEEINMIDKEREETIRELAELASTIRPSIRQLARFVIRNLDDIGVLRAHVQEVLDTESVLPSKIRAAFESRLKELGIGPDSKILIYGYSELTAPALEAIPDEWRKNITIFVAACEFAWQRADGLLAQRTAQHLNFLTQLVPDEEVCSLISRRQVTTILMGCRAVSRNGNGSVEAAHLVGSGEVSKLASKNDAKVCIVLAKRKILGQQLYRQRLLPIRRDMLSTMAMVSSRWATPQEVRVPKNDKIQGRYIDFFVTEDSVFTVGEFARKYEQELSMGILSIG